MVPLPLRLKYPSSSHPRLRTLQLLHNEIQCEIREVDGRNTDGTQAEEAVSVIIIVLHGKASVGMMAMIPLTVRVSCWLKSL